METPAERFEMWARVDLFGHNTRVGKLSVINTGVEVLYRLDLPTAEDAAKTEFYGKGAIYSIQPVSEDAARLIATKLGPSAPVSQWDLPDEWREAMRIVKAKALPEQTAVNVEDIKDEDLMQQADDMEDDRDDFDDTDE